MNAGSLLIGIADWVAVAAIPGGLLLTGLAITGVLGLAWGLLGVTWVVFLVCWIAVRPEQQELLRWIK